ncbi:MAG TPA: class I SAM-dependent methyltransferase [Mycobacteriales bacterium]|nr:class I SAM-dependent methyltransferase [Mycobacteriales bacterium]
MSPRECIVCGATPASSFPVLYTRDRYTLVRCPSCSLVFLEPQPDAEQMAAAYYHDASFSDALMGDLREITLENAREKVGLLRDTGVLREGVRALDVGASSGAWVEVGAQHGLKITGVEVGQSTAAAARARGLDIRTGTLAEVAPTLGDERFDLISFWDVLEHLPDPRSELAIARGLLAPHGRLAVTFPNVGGLFPRVTYRLFARTTGVWEYPELPVHFYDFSTKTARRLLEGAGFAVEAQRTFATPYTFYENTALSADRIGDGRKAKALRVAHDAVHRVIYPIARMADAGNSQFAVARVA